MNDVLYKKYRPTNMRLVAGQDSQVEMLNKMLKTGTLPHCLMLTGMTGCGKTTIARILKKELKCSDLDYEEFNCSNDTGIDFIRKLAERVNRAPIGGNCRIYMMDEFHRLSGAAFDSFLKLLEDYPPHVYFFLATSEETKIPKAVQNRCTKIALQPLADKDIKSVIVRCARREKKKVTDDVIKHICKIAKGSARYSLVLFNKIMDMEEEDALDILSLEGEIGEVGNVKVFCTAILNNSRWADAKNLVSTIKGDPESLRRGILAYMTKVLTGAQASKWGLAYRTIDAFSYNLNDSGIAGFTRAFYEVITYE